jgi:putative nucleotidyltransferase with HDIG domain
MKKLTLPELITKVDRLPEMPQVALRVSRLMEDPNTSANQLAELIRLDTNMTGQVLRLCNSASYGLPRKISTVREAVALMGFKSLKSLIYTVISFSALNHKVPGYSLGQGALWVNALTCAVYAKFLAEEHGYKDPEQAFTGGLLRDIGKLVLGEYVGVNYPDIEALAVQEQIDFVEAEEKVIGFNHTEVGTRVAEKWNLPERLVMAIRFHHKPSLMFDKEVEYHDIELVTLIHLADVFTMMLGAGMGSDGMMYSIDFEALEYIEFNTDEAYLESLLGRLVELNSVVHEMSGAFTPQGA